MILLLDIEKQLTCKWNKMDSLQPNARRVFRLVSLQNEAGCSQALVGVRSDGVAGAMAGNVRGTRRVHEGRGARRRGEALRYSEAVAEVARRAGQGPNGDPQPHAANVTFVQPSLLIHAAL